MMSKSIFHCRRPSGRSALFSLLLGLALAGPTQAHGGQNHACKQVRAVMALAHHNHLDDTTLHTLEQEYCHTEEWSERESEREGDRRGQNQGDPRDDLGAGAHLESRGRPRQPLPPGCKRLGLVARFASMGASKRDVKQVEALRSTVCSRGTPPSGALTYPNGRMARTTNGSWNYPNGRTARYPNGSWNFPNGRTARYANGSWNYLNGRTARYANGSWNYPSGRTARYTNGRWNHLSGRSAASESDLVNQACSKLGPNRCQRAHALLERQEGVSRVLSIIELVVEAKKQR